MSDERVELRAERLGVLVAAIGEEPSMTLDDTFDAGLAPPAWDEYLSDDALDLDHGDVALDVDLAIECVGIGRALRVRQWDALERLDGILFGAEPDAVMDAGERSEVARALVALGWDRRAGAK